MNGRSLLRLGALVGITAVWGGTFVMVKDAVAIYPVASFLAYRFVLALLVFLPFLRRIEWRSVRAGLPIGFVMGAAFILQTIGLHLTLASDTGLITGLFVVLVPLMEWLLFRNRVPRSTLVGLVLAVCGLTLLVGGLPRQLALGDLLVGVSAVGYAAQIIMLSRLSPHYETISLTVGQTFGAAAVFLAAAATPIGGGLSMPPLAVWAAIVITATLATTLGLFVQAWAQRDLPATPAAIILLTEPAWATFFGVLVSGNPFPPARIAGAALLFLTPLVITLGGTRPAQRILTYVSRREREEPAAA